MAKSAQEMFFEMAINKLIEHLPPETMDNIRHIAQTISGFKAQLNDIQTAVRELQASTVAGRISNGTRTGIDETRPDAQ